MEQPKVELSRDLSLFDITMIGVGAMIGAGIFVLTGIAAGAAGPALILSFALNGIVTIFTAMTYAELGSAIPEAGGGYLWVKEGLPGPNAFLAGWMSWFAHAVAGSLYALGFGAHVSLMLEEFNLQIPIIGEELLIKILAVLIVITFLYINYRGASETGTAGNVVTVLKIVIIGLFIISGLWAIIQNPDYLDKLRNFAPKGAVGIINAMGLTFIAFEGYEIIVQAGEEVKNPRRNIPRAVFISLAIVIPIYMLVAFVSLGAVNPETSMPTYQWLAQHAEVGVAEAARQFMPLGTILLLVGAILSTMSALNATTYSSTRVSFAMGRDKNLPDGFSDVHPKTRTPHKALFWSGVLIAFMAVAIPIEDVATAADIMFLLLFLQVNLAIITLRNKFGDRLKYGYLVPFFPYIPIIVIVFKLFLAAFLFNYSPIAWFFAIVWIVVGLVTFYLYARPRAENVEQAPVISSSRLLPEHSNEDKYHVLVSIANPESLGGLIPTAVNAAKQHNGRITLLHLITVPEQVPLAAGRDYIERTKPLQEQALDMLEGEDIPVEVLIRIAHRLDKAIIHTAEEMMADLLIMGWRGRSKDPETRVGRNIDRIIEGVNCRVLVVQQALHRQPDRILIPVDDPSQIRFGLESVGFLTGHQTAQKDVLYVFPPDMPETERRSLEKQLQERIDQFESRFPKYAGTTRLVGVNGRNQVEAISERASDYDYIIMGASQDGWLRQLFPVNPPQSVPQNVEIPVALIHPRTSSIGFGLRQIANYIRGGYREIDPRTERELQEQGLLETREETTGKVPKPRSNKPALLIVGALSLAAVAAMYIGDGSTITWVGSLAFMVVLWLFTWITLRAT